MVSIVDMLKRSEKFSLAFDRSMPIRFQQQFWQLIAFLDKHDITWFNDEPASDHAMCQQLLGQVWRQDCQDVVLSFETQERYLGWQVDEETDELSVIIEDVYGFIRNSGNHAKLCGEWKVYGDAQKAAEIFETYTRCRQDYINRFSVGIKLEELIVA